MKYIFISIFISFLICNQAIRADETESIEKNEQSEISKSKYVVGGVLGSTVGFGIGHIIQKRYGKGKGWIFTAGESAPLAYVILLWYSDSSQSCSVPDAYNNRCVRNEKSSSRTAALNTATAVFFGFKIWEVIDIWNVAYVQQNDETINRPTAGLYVLPTADNQLRASFVVNF
jgi:hypothetical protein